MTSNTMEDRIYKKSDICAVIISFNPDVVIFENVKELKKQVNEIIIVDNGSSNCDILDTIDKDKSVEIILLDKNMGIASALNIGAMKCNQKGYPLILTMDQDTVLERRSVQELLKTMNDSGAASVGINWDNKARADEEVKYLITSGNLIKMDALISVSGYDEKLFIDSVDFDFSLRLLEKNYKIVKSAKAKARHRLGEKQNGTDYVTHSVSRYYYIYRNHFYLIRKYWRNHKLFCLKKQMALIYDLLRILIYDEHRKEKLEMLKRGYVDAKKISLEQNI